MFEKKTVEIKTPDLKKMQEIIIDLRTRIYVPIEEDPQKARERYMTKFQTMKKFWYQGKSDDIVQKTGQGHSAEGDPFST